MASRRFTACAFCSGRKVEALGLGDFGQRSKQAGLVRIRAQRQAVQAGPDSSGCLRNFSWASTGKDDKAYSR